MIELDFAKKIGVAADVLRDLRAGQLLEEGEDWARKSGRVVYSQAGIDKTLEALQASAAVRTELTTPPAPEPAPGVFRVTRKARWNPHLLFGVRLEGELNGHANGASETKSESETTIRVRDTGAVRIGAFLVALPPPAGAGTHWRALRVLRRRAQPTLE